MEAIVYTSNTGHTASYAKILGERLGLPCYRLEEAKRILRKKSKVLYLGWLFVNHVKGYRTASKRFSVSAVCAVGLCDTGTAIPEVRKTNRIPESIPLFTLQGGIDKTSLTGINKYMIQMLIKGLNAQKEKNSDTKRILYLLTHDANYVSEENTAEFLDWFQKFET